MFYMSLYYSTDSPVSPSYVYLFDKMYKNRLLLIILFEKNKLCLKMYHISRKIFSTLWRVSIFNLLKIYQIPSVLCHSMPYTNCKCLLRSGYSMIHLTLIVPVVFVCPSDAERIYQSLGTVALLQFHIYYYDTSYWSIEMC